MSGHARARAAIIGAGLMGRWHADAVKRIGGRVSVIVDPDLDALTALGKRHPGARLAVELDPSLVAREATAAHVCTPLGTHEGIVARLIAAGVHVLAEKPLTEDAQGTERLLSLAASHGVLVLPSISSFSGRIQAAPRLASDVRHDSSRRVLGVFGGRTGVRRPDPR